MQPHSLHIFIEADEHSWAKPMSRQSIELVGAYDRPLTTDQNPIVIRRLSSRWSLKLLKK